MAKVFLVVDCCSLNNFSSLTKHRVPGAIPFLSKYRMIDIPLSLATKANIVNVGVFCDRNYRSLQDHIGSGRSYNLDRRRDGIFILPPKTQSPIYEDYLSFQKMREQDEYFRRSDQEYVIITPSTLIWNADYLDILKSHIDSKKDITQVIHKDGERLFTFVISKEKLMKYIESYGTISFRNIVEVFDYSNKETKNTYCYNGYALYIRSIEDYYKTSMDFLNNENSELSNLLYSLRTKEPLDSPTYYDENADVKNSILATGIHVDGNVESSIIARRVDIKKGAVIKNSIVMNNCVIEENATVINAILDKETVVKFGSNVVGGENQPFVSEKKQIVYSSSIKNVVVLAVELMPFIKRGGLSDMVGSLVKELSYLGTDMKVFLPLYQEVKDKYLNLFDKKNDITITIDKKKYHINVYSLEREKLTYYFIDLYMFFDRKEVYGYEDDALRFTYFTKAVVEYLDENKINVDVFHAHDWHTALLPLILKQYKRYEKSSTILTIHNLNYQGETDKSILDEFKLEYNVTGEKLNILEAGINSFKEITTVSKTYAEELKYDYYSRNLKEAILRRQSNLYGIINGLNSEISPEKDLEIKAQYNIDNVFEKKIENKKFLCSISGFEYREDMFIIGGVSRINEIKGFDLIINSLPEILKDKRIHYCILGVGDPKLMKELKDLENRYKGQIKTFQTFDATNPYYIYSGSDCFLMPSRIEPCGTSQLIALKYGTIPIVRQTGGLNDTVQSFDSISMLGNGFKFYNSDSQDLIYTLKFAFGTYIENKEAWKVLIKNAMKCDYSFTKCAKEYLNLYNKKDNLYE